MGLTKHVYVGPFLVGLSEGVSQCFNSSPQFEDRLSLVITEEGDEIFLPNKFEGKIPYGLEISEGNGYYPIGGEERVLDQWVWFNEEYRVELEW